MADCKSQGLSLAVAACAVAVGLAGPAPALLAADEPAAPASPRRIHYSASAPGAAPGAEPWHFDAEQLILEPNGKVLTAQGAVELRVGPMQLSCDRLTLFLDTHDIYAQGQIRWTDGAQRFVGDAAHYNLKTNKGRFLRGTFFGPTWQVASSKVELLTPEVVVAEDASVSSCDLTPPHYAFKSGKAQVFYKDQVLHASHISLNVGRTPLLYLPWVEAAYREAPFFLVPGRTKAWGEFVQGGYRVPLPGTQQATIHGDWRRVHGWGTGLTYRGESPQLGQGLLKLYFNEQPNQRRPLSDLPKGAEGDRYRAFWRHKWEPLADTTVLTNVQEYSDADFRRELLFREEFTQDDSEKSFISAITATPDYTLSALVQKRMNRYEAIDEALPQVTLSIMERPIGETGFYSDTTLDFANLNRKRAHSDNDADVGRADWVQRISYALTAFKPLEVTPHVAYRETFYTKDRQGGSERRHGRRDFFSGQFSTGADASLKFFKTTPIESNWLGLNLNTLRHVLTPSVNYRYVHQSTTPNALLHFPASEDPENALWFDLRHTVQTKRAATPNGPPASVDLVRSGVSVPYTVKSRSNKEGGRFGDWLLDFELMPWRWLRLETDAVIPSHFATGSRDGWITTWNGDVVIVGGRGVTSSTAPRPQSYDAHRMTQETLLPKGEWLVGLGHRYSQNDKTDTVLELAWRISDKWQIGTFERLTWKAVTDQGKQLHRFREFQIRLQRDLHDWIAGATYYVDRELGQEVFFTLTLKAYPGVPVGFGTSYRPPKNTVGAL